MSVLKSNFSLYNVRVDSAVDIDTSASSNVWAVDVCVVDQTVIALRTEYTACNSPEEFLLFTVRECGSPFLTLVLLLPRLPASTH